MKTRSEQKELMDLGPDYYTKAEYEECLKKLFLVGKYTGLHRDTYKLVKSLKPKTLLDVGCGDGALLAAIAKKLPECKSLGIDISDEAIQHATRYRQANLNFSCTQILQPADIIMANLVCHHMTNSELEEFLHQAYQKAGRLVLINDLQRHKVAKALFGLLSGPLFSNRLISLDGITSIERGFHKHELKGLLNNVAPNSWEIRWRFPFRWQVLIWKK